MNNKEIIPLNLISFIHTKEGVPECMLDNWNNMVRENPTFNCQLYDISEATEFIKDNFDVSILNAFNKLKPYAYKSDLFRYCYLYKNGGIYVDIKYHSIHNFKFIELTDKEYLVKESLGVQNCLLALKKNNELMLNCIHQVVNFTETDFYSSIPVFTGPYLLSQLYKEIYNEEINQELHWGVENYLHIIYKNNSPILIQYQEYRNDLTKMINPQKHYNYLFWDKEIYN